MLLSNDGPHRNVLKFKSPLVFGDKEVTKLLALLDSVFTEMEDAKVRIAIKNKMR